MKFIAFCLLSVLTIPTGMAAGFSEGKEYVKLPLAQPTQARPGKVEVREIFWYGCPHCYTLEEPLRNWVAKNNARIDFVRTPWTYVRAIIHAKIFYTFETMGVTARAHSILFDAIHRDKMSFNDIKALAVFLAPHGVNENEFLKSFDSFGVHVAVQKATALNDAYQIDSVPAVIVDGKYRTGASMTEGNHEKLLQVVEFLVNKSLQEKKALRR